MDYKLLGPLRVLRDGEPLPLGGPKQRAVLAVLLLSHGHVVEFGAVIEAVWNGNPPVKAISSVRAYVANLRRVLGPESLVTTSYGYRLDLGTGELDVDCFESLAAAGRIESRNGNHARACELLSEALDVWTGQPLEDLRDLAVSVHETHRLDELRADIVEAYFDCRLMLGHHIDIVGQLEDQIVISPLRERLWWQLMLALYRANRRADALRAFGRAELLLNDELGIEPGAALVSLEAEIRRQSATLGWLEQGDTPGIVGRPDSCLFGRDAEMQRIDDALVGAQCGVGRVIVLAGEAGIGKTAIAGEAVLRAESVGFTAAWSCPPEGIRQPQLWSWVQVLRALGDNVGRGQLVRAAEVIAPQLLELLPGWPLPSSVLPSNIKENYRADFLILDSVVLALHRLVEGHPTLVVLDDLDRADRASREVLQLVVGNLRQLPLVIVATWQDNGVETRSRRGSLIRLTNKCDTTLLRINALDVDATARMVAHAGTQEQTFQLAEFIHRRTGGNPYYTAEVIREIRIDPTRRDCVPDSVAAVIRSRTSTLPPETRKDLRIAAAQPEDLIARPSTHLEPAVAAGLLVQLPNSNAVRFLCPLVRDALAAQRTRLELADAVRVDATRLVRVASTSTDNLWQQLTS